MAAVKDYTELTRKIGETLTAWSVAKAMSGGIGMRKNDNLAAAECLVDLLDSMTDEAGAWVIGSNSESTRSPKEHVAFNEIGLPVATMRNLHSKEVKLSLTILLR